MLNGFGFTMVTFGLLLILIPVVNLYRINLGLQRKNEKLGFLLLAICYAGFSVMFIIIGIIELMRKT